MNSSLQGRLAWRLAIVFAAVILATALALFFHRRATVSDIPSETLTELLDHIAGSLSLGPDGRPRLVLEEDDGRFDYAVATPNGEIVLASTNPPPPAPAGWKSGFLSRNEPGGERVLGYAHADTALGPMEIRVAMEVGRSAAGFGPLIRELRDEMLPVLLPAFLAAIAIGTLTLRWGLRPLQKLASEATRITANESERRLPVQGLPRELAPPVQAINAALDRLDRGFRAQRDFTADAAHQLRTPLAILAAHLDTLGDQSVAAPLRQDVARMSRLVDQLLLVAELEALTLKADERTDISALGAEVVEAVAPLALAHGRSLALTGSERPVIVHGNHDSLHHALRNLVENAVGHTPERSTVEIEVGDSPPRLSVRDHGPGVGAGDRDKLFQRFWRGDREGTPERGRGAGLGLAIVKRIADTHGAKLSFADAPKGGAIFSIEFPPRLGRITPA
jgi:signal transduction histidine kinase